MDNAMKDKLYTYADYKTYPENERVELIEGQIYAMTPSPSRAHQKLIMELSAIIHNHIKANKGSCEVYPAPFDVILNDKGDMDSSRNVVQPDVSVICDKNKLNDKGCLGAPDLIIEVVSPFNPRSDYVRKLNLYDIYGVKEYWIINPMNESVFVYRIDENGTFTAPEAHTFKSKVKVGIFENLIINFNDISL